MVSTGRDDETAIFHRHTDIRCKYFTSGWGRLRSNYGIGEEIGIGYGLPLWR